jgi:hypothetical protein
MTKVFVSTFKIFYKAYLKYFFDEISGLVNGSVGYLRAMDHAEYDDGRREPVTLYFEFLDPAVGRDARATIGTVHENRLWTPIQVDCQEIYSKQGCSVTRTQFPVVCAKGISYW